MIMIPNPSPFNHVIAFEVAKHRLVVHSLPCDAQCSIANTKAAVRRLLRAEAKAHAKAGSGQLLVVCEATGEYERHVLEAALELGLACHRAHGARVRHFARYLGLGAKTDTIDARLLALYGMQTQNLRLYTPPSPEQEALRALKDRREEVQAMLIAETQRLDHAHKAVRTSLLAHMRILKAMLERLEGEIAQLVQASPALARPVHLMQSVIGIGPVTATALLAYLPELGAITRGQAARLTGLAPLNQDSGKTNAPRHISPGRSGLKRALYMAATIAMRFNPKLKAFAARLKAKGKPFKVVVTATMRKLVTILNAIIRDNQPAKP